MPMLDADNQKSIVDGVSRIVELSDAGTDPTDAMAKVAADLEWGPHAIKLAGYAFNTAQANAHRRTAKTAAEKFADVALVDIPKAVDRVWGNPDKKAQAAPAWEPASVSSIASRSKAKLPPLSSFLPETKAAAAPAVDEAAERRRAYLDSRKAFAESEAIGRKAAMAEQEMAAEFDRLTTYIRNRRDSFPALRKTAAAYFGDAVCGLLDGSADIAGARNGPVGSALSRLSDHAEPMANLSRCFELAKMAGSLRDQEAAARKPYDDYEASRKPEPASKEADIGGILSGAGLKSMFDTVMGGIDNSDQSNTRKFVDTMNDPAHEGEMRKVRAQATLAELLGDDEVLSGYDPDEVARAYNEVVQLAPDSANKPAALRALLRRHVQGRTEPFELKETVEVGRMLGQGGNEYSPSVLDRKPQTQETRR